MIVWLKKKLTVHQTISRWNFPILSIQWSCGNDYRIIQSTITRRWIKAQVKMCRIRKIWIFTFVKNNINAIALEYVAEWIRRWTRDLGVGVRFPQRRLCVKTLGKIWIHTATVHPAVMGNRWNENQHCVNGYSCRNLRFFLSREMWKNEFQYLGVINV